MNINKEQYEEIYFGIENIPPYELFLSEPDSDEDFIMNYVSSKLWRLNNLYTIIDKVGNKIKFVMNRAQHVVYAQHLRHPRILILKSRQQGISTFYLIDYFDDAVFISNILVGMQSYGLEESAALLKRLDVAWDNFSEALKEFLGLRVTKSNTKALGFSNGSEIRVQTSFRGESLQRLHVSELGKIAAKNPQKAVELKAGTLQAIKAGNPVAIESTAEGMHNAFYQWWYAAIGHIGERSLKDFNPTFLSWVDDPDCNAYIPQLLNNEHNAYFDEVEAYMHEHRDNTWFLSNTQKWWVAGQMRELGELFNQEYPYSDDAAFASVRDGTYYARLWREKGSVREGLYDPALLVHVSLDLGMNDTTELGFWQVHQKSVRLVDYYYNSGEGLEHYVNLMKQKAKLDGYKYGKVVLPHDIKVRELGAGKSRLAILRDMGVRNTVVLSRADILTGIEQVRKMIPYLTIDPIKCDRVIQMMGRYTKGWDANLGVFKDKPLHDEWSNPADMMRYFAMSRLWSRKSDNGTDDTHSARPVKKRRSRTNVVDGLAL